MKAWFAAFALLTSGCLSHMPADHNPVHLRIHWAPDFAQAQATASAARKPILVCMVGGDILDQC